MENSMIKKQCDGKCENCSMNQRIYCAAQMAYYNQEEIGQIKAILANIAVASEGCIILKGKVAENAVNEPVKEDSQDI